MKKKGFTLIELLAVIVILAIIALIIVPVVANIIESARFGAAKDSVLEYVHAANQYGALSLAGVSDDGLNINGTLESGVNDSELEKIKYSGTKFDYIYMEFDESNNVTNGSFCINGYSIDYNGGDVSRTIGYCNEQAGLYDENNKIVKTWDELVALGIDIETDYTTSTVTESTSGTSVLKNVLDDAKGKLILPNTITKIGSYVFYNSKNLANISLPSSVTNIGTASFRETTLKKINIPNSVTTLGQSAFASSDIESITLGTGITYVSQGFCDSCTNLTTVKMGNNITTIHPYAFYGTTSLKNVKLPSTVTTIGAYMFDSSGIEKIVIPEGVTVIPDNAFNYANNLKKVILPSTTTTISDNAFHNTALQNVVIPANVTTIGSAVFSGCSSLTSVVFENTEGWKNWGSSIDVSDPTANANLLKSGGYYTRQ